MKVSDRFILRTVADEYLLIPVGEAAISVKGLIALSESGALLYKRLKNDCSKDDLVVVLRKEYDVSLEEAVSDTEAFLDRMRQLNMLIEE